MVHAGMSGKVYLGHYVPSAPPGPTITHRGGLDMERYKNLSGNSGIVVYEIGDDSIKVEFRDGHLYLYTYQSAGRINIEKMKELAIAGRGLNTFISKFVRKHYASRLR